MAGEPLCKLERAAGTAAGKLGTCEIARHFTNRVVPDIAFVAGLPARILAARATVEPDLAIPIAISTLSGAVHRGCDSPEALANTVHLGRDVSRVAARKEFQAVRKHIQPGNEAEAFETTLEGVRRAYMPALFDDE